MKMLPWVTCVKFEDAGYEPSLKCGICEATYPIRELGMAGTGPFLIRENNIVVKREVTDDGVRYTVHTVGHVIYSENPGEIAGISFEEACRASVRKEATFTVPFLDGKEPALGGLENVQINFAEIDQDQSKIDPDRNNSTILGIDHEFGGGSFRDLVLLSWTEGNVTGHIKEEVLLALIGKGIASLGSAKFQVTLLRKEAVAELPDISLMTIRIEALENTLIQIGRRLPNSGHGERRFHKALEVDLVFSERAYEQNHTRSRDIEALCLTEYDIRPIIE